MFKFFRQQVLDFVRHLVTDLNSNEESLKTKDETREFLDRCSICTEKGAKIGGRLGRLGMIVGGCLGANIGCLWHALVIWSEGNLKPFKIVPIE